MTKKKRPRTERRAAQVEARRLVRAREQLARAEAGGTAEHPIVVVSSSVIEVRARAMPCPQCQGECRIVEHRAERDAAGESVRAVEVECLRCGVRRVRWFKIDAPLAN